MFSIVTIILGGIVGHTVGRLIFDFALKYQQNFHQKKLILQNLEIAALLEDPKNVVCEISFIGDRIYQSRLSKKDKMTLESMCEAILISKGIDFRR